MHCVWSTDFIWACLGKFLDGISARNVTQVCRSANKDKLLVWQCLSENYHPKNQISEESALSTLIGIHFLIQSKVKEQAVTRLTRDEVLQILRLRPNVNADDKLRRGNMNHCKIAAILYSVSPGTIRKIW